jgi:DNA-binding NarL/FixJ family response regulator
VDDDPFVRASLATILGAHPDIIVCAECADGHEAQQCYREHRPDVMLLDIQMPSCDGLMAAEAILSEDLAARIVFLTTFTDDEYLVTALKLGARGYLVKQEVATIAPALRAVMAGQLVLGGEVLGRMDALVGMRAPTAEALPEDGLTEREAEVVAAVASGLDNKEIAQRLFISEGTVRNHVSVILQKLGLKNRTQLAVRYYQRLSGKSGI